jgi:chemotaxis protein MotA
MGLLEKYDVGTFLGAIVGVVLIVTAIMRGGSIDIFLSLSSLMIVMGGSLATTFIAFHYSKIFVLVPVIVHAFKPDNHHPLEFINIIIQLLKKYRKDGRKALEKHHEFLGNRFFEQGIRMIIDDYKAEEINDLLAKSINAIKERHTQGQSIIRFMGAQAPIFGMMGTLIGLIQMMENLSDPSAIGPGLAVALNTTFYGILLSNLVFNPLAVKLSTRTDSETHLIKVIQSGVLGIKKKSHHILVSEQMNAFLSQSEKTDGSESPVRSPSIKKKKKI